MVGVSESRAWTYAEGFLSVLISGLAVHVIDLCPPEESRCSCSSKMYVICVQVVFYSNADAIIDRPKRTI